MPAVKNADELERLLKEAAVLDFKICPPAVAQRAATDKKYANDVNGAYKDCGPVVYTGAELKSASPGFGQGGEPQVDFTTKNPTKFANLTRDHMGQLLTIFLDHKYVSYASIEGVISTDGMIHGSFTEDQVAELSNELNAGALPVPLTIIEKDDVGATLGQEDLQKSLVASIIGLALVLVFMIVMYRLPGVLADVALFVYVLMLLALLSVAHAVLTLPGIAGFVLSIGMAVDANVLIFERIKEELWAGKSLRAAVRIGFQRAFSSVFDSHFTTIVGAGVLYMLGTGTVKGFAYTLFWGTVFSLLTAVVITRFFVDVVVDNNLVTSKAAYGAGGTTAVPVVTAEVALDVLPSSQLERRRLVPHRLGDLVRRHRPGRRDDDLQRGENRRAAAAGPLVHRRHRRHGQVHPAGHQRRPRRGAGRDQGHRRAGQHALQAR